MEASVDFDFVAIVADWLVLELTLFSLLRCKDVEIRNL